MTTKPKQRFILLPQDHTVLVRQTSKWGQIFLLSLVGLGATAFITAWLYRIDEVITVQGRLVPKQGGVEVKSPFNGQLEELLVKNGEKVEKGKLLLRFDVERTKARKATLEKQIVLEETRLRDRLDSNTKRKETLTRNLMLNEKILNRLKPLERDGAISEIQILQKQNEIESQKDELIQIETQREQIINDSKSKREEYQGQINGMRSRLKNEFVKAPIGGIVFDLKPDNNRYVATNAEPLLKIIPKGQLGAEVNVINKDIGFIKQGQEVRVRIDSFPYTEYGEIKGKIANLGADALPPTNIIQQYHFPVDIELEQSSLETKEKIKIPLQAGMTITSNLKLRDRRLIELWVIYSQIEAKV